MGKKLYVGNLPFVARDEDLARKFGEVGTVESARIITDRDTGRSKGFGFVEMSSESEAQAAIERFNGQDYEGRPLTVNIARPQESRPSGGRGGFGGGRRDGGYRDNRRT